MTMNPYIRQPQFMLIGVTGTADGKNWNIASGSRKHSAKVFTTIP